MDLKKCDVFQWLDPVFLSDVKYASFIGIDECEEMSRIFCEIVILKGGMTHFSGTCVFYR